MALVSLYCAVCGMPNSPQNRVCSRCAAPLPFSPSPQVGQARASSQARGGNMAPDTVLKQRYVIMERLGRGGMGAVYKAADTELGSAYRAVKEMRRAYSHPQDPPDGAADAFRREALMLADLRHQSLPRIYDHFQYQGSWYLVMDYIEGTNLEDYLKVKGGKLAVVEVLEIGILLCNVLEYLHTRQPPVIFRDLKPANIMRTRDGHIYLIDFGIARIFKSGQAKDTSVFVSYGYAAPEQYSGIQTTPLADIYGLGATLHQLISGDDPAKMPLPWAFKPLHLGDQFSAAGLGRLIMQMLEMEPGKRPSSVTKVKQELQRIAAGRSTVVIPAYNVPSNVRPPASAIAPHAPLGTVLCTYSGHTAHVLGLSWSTDGKWIASAGSDKTVQIWDTSSGKNVQTYRRHTFVVQAVAWSPDERYIASAGDDRTVQVWNANTGELVLAYQGHSGYVTMLAWSPDSSSIASASSDRTIQIWDAIKGRRRLTYRGHPGTLSAMAWSPDGANILSTSWVQERDKQGIPHHRTVIAVWSALTGEAYAFQTPQPLSVASINSLSWSPDGK